MCWGRSSKTLNHSEVEGDDQPAATESDPILDRGAPLEGASCFPHNLSRAGHRLMLVTSAADSKLRPMSHALNLDKNAL